jgi:hypothetical protein
MNLLADRFKDLVPASDVRKRIEEALAADNALSWRNAVNGMIVHAIRERARDLESATSEAIAEVIRRKEASS